jgi:TatD DNase family protein
MDVVQPNFPTLPLTKMIIDTHAHLDDEAFEPDLPEVLQRAQEVGVEAIVCPALDLTSCQKVLALAGKFPVLYPAVGIQPNSVARCQAEDWMAIEQLARLPQVVAIGETGLDRHWDMTPFPMQEEYFDRHLWLAGTRSLPVIVHCREAETAVLRHLKKAVERYQIRGVIHAFSSDPTAAAEFLGLGFYLSFAGSVTYRNKKFELLRKVATMVPEDRLLIETDSPYLTPEPFRGKIKRNEPALLKDTLALLAKLRGTELQSLARTTTQNARRLFKLPGNR